LPWLPGWTEVHQWTGRWALPPSSGHQVSLKHRFWCHRRWGTSKPHLPPHPLEFFTFLHIFFSWRPRRNLLDYISGGWPSWPLLVCIWKFILKI
jgi:hypothetical protein